jgi:hypothetical protein
MSSGRAAALLLVLTAAPALAQAPDGSNVFQ